MSETMKNFCIKGSVFIRAQLLKCPTFSNDVTKNERKFQDGRHFLSEKNPRWLPFSKWLLLSDIIYLHPGRKYALF